MGNLLHEFFKKEEDIEKYTENAIAEQDKAVMRLYQQRKLINNALESISMLLSNQDVVEFYDNKEYIRLTKSRSILQEWLKKIDRQIDVI